MATWGADGRFHPLTEQIIAAAIEVHRTLGPGLLESTYEECLDWELRERKINVARQIVVPLTYKQKQLGSIYRLDLLVDDKVVVEVKAVDKLGAIHDAQMLTYLRHTGLRIGLILNGY
jgi:GxxExxY protein